MKLEKIVFLVEIDKNYSDMHYIAAQTKEFEISDVVTLTYRDFPYFLSMFSGYRNFQRSGIISGWYFNDIQNLICFPIKLKNPSVGLLAIEKNKTASSFLYI